MILLALVLVFLVTVASGPAGQEYRNKRKQLAARPLAKVIPFPYPKDHPKKI